MRTTVPPAVDSDGFTTLYATFRPKVEGYIAARLPRRDSQLAEDLAAEVFLSLWRSHFAPGRDVEVRHPWGLLATVASRRIADHFRLHRNYRETTSDMTSWQYANRDLTSGNSGAWSPLSSGLGYHQIGGGHQ
ncbi:sigma factor [Streptomyces stelliscabiei]|uniref:RNA polymerase sigma factor n=1 Tax=Streptomyces stelliscabiei TaxID=146820 RepID=UPI0029AD249D|nr:sigma factor [Streptomyces stelliscabiei]MDX2515476.1 sigma factor [Streptomyces stelliscabiei]